MRLARHGEELGRGAGPVGVQPGRGRAKALRHDHLFAKALIRGRPRVVPVVRRLADAARAHEAARQGRRAVGTATLHVHLVHEFVDHHAVAAVLASLARALHGGPAQHHRAVVGTVKLEFPIPIYRTAHDGKTLLSSKFHRNLFEKITM